MKNKRNKYIIFFTLLLTMQHPAFSQFEWMGRFAVKMRPVFVLCEQNGNAYDKAAEEHYKNFHQKNVSFKILDKNTNPKKVHRLFLYGHDFPSQYPITKTELPNLKELVLCGACAIPTDFTKYAKLKYLHLQYMVETCSEYENKMADFSIRYVFPSEIYELKHLKQLYCSMDDQIKCNFVSEQLFNIPRVTLFRKRCSIDYDDYYYSPICNLMRGIFFDGRSKYNKRVLFFQPQGAFTRKFDCGVVIQGQFHGNKPCGEWRITYPTDSLEYYEDYKSAKVSKESSFTEIRYYKNGLEDSVWSIVNNRGDTLRRDYFENGVYKKFEIFLHHVSNAFEKETMINIDDYPNRTTVSEKMSGHGYTRWVQNYKNNLSYQLHIVKVDSLNMVRTENYLDDSVNLKCERDNILLCEMNWTKSSDLVHYKYYVSERIAGEPRVFLDCSSVTEEFFVPQYFRIEYHQDSTRKYLYHRMIYDEKGQIFNQDTVKIKDNNSGTMCFGKYLSTDCKIDTLKY